MLSIRHIVHPLVRVPSPPTALLDLQHLEGVVLRRNLDVKVIAQDGNLLHDVLAHAGDLGEEEEGEDSGYAAETAGEDTAVGVLDMP